MCPLFIMRKGFNLITFLLMVGMGSISTLSAQNNPSGVPVENMAAQGAAGDTGSFGSFQNQPADVILDAYEKLSGKHLVIDTNIMTAAPHMTINAAGVSKAEFLKLVEATLLLNGVALVPMDEHTMKAVVIQSKNPRGEGIKLYANEADLPTDDEIVSYYMPLNYLGAQEVANTFSQNAQGHPYAVFIPMVSAQAVIMTENTSVIRQLIALKELMDVPPAKVVTEFVQLKRADSDTVAALLTKMLNPPPTPGAPAVPGGNPSVPADVGNTSPLSNERNLITGTAQIISDPRSNSLLIVSRPVNMPFLKELVTQLDSPNNFLVPKRRALKYVLAQDILVALETALAQGKDEQDQVSKNQTSANNTNNQNNRPGGTSGNGTLNSGGSAGGGAALSSVTSPLQEPAQNSVPTVVTVGKTRLMADNNSNSIIVFGSPDVVERVFDMIDELDRKPLQVYLASVIGELTMSQGTEFGIDLLQKFLPAGQNGIASSLITPGTNTAGSGAVPEISALTTSGAFPLPAGVTIYGLIGNTLEAYVRALETTNRFKVISRPSVFITNNKLGVIASGTSIPVPTSTITDATGATGSLAQNSTINYQSVLLELQIIPLINANHEVTLQIRQTNNSQGASQIISGNSVPSILTQEINTSMTVHDRQTIVIGGLITDNNKRDTSGVPFLSDIPGLGYLFKDTSKSKERDELIIMIQPNVVETDQDEIVQNEIEKRRTLLGAEAEAAASQTVEEDEKGHSKLPVHPPTSGDIGVAVPIDSQASAAPAPVKKKTVITTQTIESMPPAPASSSSAPNVKSGQAVKDTLPPTTP